ncbi:helix-turn-helix domain-containing protein [Suttonella ornithocola]|uniref:Anaerobic benzoate catabolism transcriptional regulator n=1 Tax=Suttonella ornithocola TaxID=279832 RepID=A0A380MZJ6_9GAMM|nr:helix-turn-helix transcriptional regulator [Suttonella ornithocola]SUO97654.1 anaerobic benzoate catabolism transcriptional regulator [Suttonella ornithocola]
MQVNEKVRMMRELRQWSQEEMAEKLQMSTAGYAKLERGETQFNIPKLEKVASIFGIDLKDLMAINERSVICLINENSQHSSNYYGTSEDLSQEITKLKLMLSHQEEIISAKELLLEQQAREIHTLQRMIELLQKKCC